MVRCLRDLLAAYDVLAAHRFAVGAQAVSVSVSDSRKSNSALFKGEFAVPATRSGVNARIECSGMVAVKHDSFEVTLDECTKVEGVSGSVFGPAVILDEGASRVLSGAKLQKWITERGADIRVVTQKLIYPIPPRVRAQHLQ